MGEGDTSVITEILSSDHEHVCGLQPCQSSWPVEGKKSVGLEGEL